MCIDLFRFGLTMWLLLASMGLLLSREIGLHLRTEANLMNCWSKRKHHKSQFPNLGPRNGNGSAADKQYSTDNDCQVPVVHSSPLLGG